MEQKSLFSDSHLAENIGTQLFQNRVRWCEGIGWLFWEGKRWIVTSDVEPLELMREHLANVAAETWHAFGRGEVSQETAKASSAVLGAGKLRAVLGLTKGITGVLTKAEDLDAHPDLLNTPSGIVYLKDGTLYPHGPAFLLTKITTGSYVPGRLHPDWSTACQALPATELAWLQVRIGQGATGHPTPDGVMPLLQGGGENGKSLMTGAVVHALGDYGSPVSPKLIAGGKGTEHSTEMADLRGRRLIVGEELTEGRALDITTMKRIQDVEQIRARLLFKDNITFTASHSLMVTSNYRPRVDEVDHGTWRRLALLEFPYAFKKAHEFDPHNPTHRLGDPNLKARIRANQTGQLDAVVTWVVEGAIRSYREGSAALAPTSRIAAATSRWRGEADRIWAFWAERLVADPEARIRAVDVFESFNAWLRGNGHQPWATETFGPRFEDHSQTQRAGVVKRRTKGTATRMSADWQGISVDPSQQAICWIGVRWRTPADELAEEPTAA